MRIYSALNNPDVERRLLLLIPEAEIVDDIGEADVVLLAERSKKGRIGSDDVCEYFSVVDGTRTVLLTGSPGRFKEFAREAGIPEENILVAENGRISAGNIARTLVKAAFSKNGGCAGENDGDEIDLVWEEELNDEGDYLPARESTDKTKITGEEFSSLIIPVVRFKGGVGCTAVAVSLAAFFDVSGRSVVLVDAGTPPSARFQMGLPELKERGLFLTAETAYGKLVVTQKINAVRDIASRADYVVVDLPSEPQYLDDILSVSSAVVVVLDQDERTLENTLVWWDRLKTESVVVLNKVDYNSPWLLPGAVRSALGNPGRFVEIPDVSRNMAASVAKKVSPVEESEEFRSAAAEVARLLRTVVND